MPKLRFVAEIMNPQHRDACIRAFEQFWDSDRRRDAWPESAYVDLGDVDLMALPLERVGAPPGESRAHVFVAYYCVRDRAPQIKPSRPFAVKMHGNEEMERELKDAEQLPRLDPKTEERFAKPIDCYPIDDSLAVLVAPFGSVYEPGEPQEVRVRDLWALLNKADWLAGEEYHKAWERVSRYMQGAFDLVGGLHKGGTYRRRTRSYAEALEWYLRDTREPAGSEKSRAHIPQGIFGNKRMVRAFNREWVNPTHVIDRFLLSESTFRTNFGAIHGDLHPKNVVVDKSERPHIIDFGWARTDGAIVVDYILMDINLRSITLPSQVQESEVLEMARFLTRDRKPTSMQPLLQRRVDLIQDAIWDRVENRKVVLDWHREYVIPFFIMAYGLLVHLDKARNQMALVATVLAAAEYIDGAHGK